MRFLSITFVTISLAVTSILRASATTQPVTVQSTDDSFTLSNGLIQLTIARKTGVITTFKDLTQPNHPDIGAPGGAMYWDANVNVPNLPSGIHEANAKGYVRLSGDNDFAKLISQSPDRAEIACIGGPTPTFPFRVEYHYVVFKNTSGFYAYAELSHTATDPAATFFQTRFVFRTVDDDTFDHWSVGPNVYVPIPKAAIVEKVTDATFRLADGTVKTKYLNSVYWAATPVYGVLGTRPNKGVGIWMIEPSPEYHNGGPVKQGQTVHDNVLLRVLQSVHFGASPLVFKDNEPWRKVYGPFLVYLNHADDAKALWNDANTRLQAEQDQWPYDWVQSPNYQKQQGTVTGKLTLYDDPTPNPGLAAGLRPARPASSAWVILADPGSPWTAQGKNYQFWTRADANGNFTIPKVIPGSYTLYASGADQPEDFSRDNISVTTNQTTDLGTLTWTPITHGQKIWQIGTFDRSAAEFRNGDDARQYQMFSLYPKQFPNDVNFTIGTSDIKKDWNYAQWSWYVKDPKWRIHFDLPNAPAGSATLTIGFASAQPAHGKTTDLRVAVNDHEIAAIHLPKTGTAGYRGGTQDSPYNVRYLTFDAGLLHAGTNEITLAHADAEPFRTVPDPPTGSSDDEPPGAGGPGQVMYDAIRLELQHATQPVAQLDARFSIGQLLYSDDFQSDSHQWIAELESGGSVTHDGGRLDINVPAGASIWFKPQLKGPLLIQYQATAIKADGPNDRVSDLNCFWMARDSRNLDDLFAVQRTGKFADYNQLKTYYVGQGGNDNTTTRFRRYIGDPILRPLLPQYDLHDPADLLKPNTRQVIQLVVDNGIIQYYHGGKRIFDFQDDHPYTSGWFAFRTTKSHLQISNFRVFVLTDNPVK